MSADVSPPPHVGTHGCCVPAVQVCIFAYGQTGSGKTHTMLGSRDHPGMIPRAMRQIFDSSQKLTAQGWQFNMQVSSIGQSRPLDNLTCPCTKSCLSQCILNSVPQACVSMCGR